MISLRYVVFVLLLLIHEMHTLMRQNENRELVMTVNHYSITII